MSDLMKSAVVVGGTAGVGRAIVAQLVEQGYCVTAIARGEARLREVEAAHGRDRVCGVAADAGLPDEVEDAADAAVAAFGPPSVWVNSAMVTSFSPFEKMDPDEFEAIVRTTFFGQVNGTRAALRVMRRGTIVSIGSGLAYRAIPYQSAYCAAKHAINGFNGAIRSELLRVGHPVRLTQIQLPAVNTPQFDWARNRLEKRPQPAPPIFQPEVPARAVMKAIEGDHREIWVGKSVVQLILGNTVLPAWLDSKLAEEGVAMQKSDEPEPGGRPDNLMHPVDHPATAHGRFDDRARSDGTIVDGDLIRKLVWIGSPLAAFVLGLLLG